MKILSVRDHPEKAEMFIRYFQKHWATENSMAVYDDCIRNCITAKSSLPMWYLLLDGEDTIGCAGLITNDFISRWICIRGFAHFLLKRGIAAMHTVHC